MRHIIFTILTLVAMSMLLTDCSSTKAATTATAATSTPKPAGPYMPTDQIASAHGSTVEQLVKGREIFTQNCDRCHKLKNPSIHDAAGWTSTMRRMAPKAKLSDADAKLVLDYLSAAN
jgi:cytochrome c5